MSCSESRAENNKTRAIACIGDIIPISTSPVRVIQLLNSILPPQSSALRASLEVFVALRSNV